MRLRTIRMSEATLEKLSARATAGGHRTVSALMREVLDREVTDERGPEQRIAATLDQIRLDIKELTLNLRNEHEDLSALFMLVDALAKLLATVLPEGGVDSRVRGQRRYDLLLKAAAAGLSQGVPKALRPEPTKTVTPPSNTRSPDGRIAPSWLKGGAA